MSQEELMNAIAEIEREIAILPEGSITKKKIRDKEYYYHRNLHIPQELRIRSRGTERHSASN